MNGIFDTVRGDNKNKGHILAPLSVISSEMKPRDLRALKWDAEAYVYPVDFSAPFVRS